MAEDAVVKLKDGTTKRFSELQEGDEFARQDDEKFFTVVIPPYKKDYNGKDEWTVQVEE